MIGNFFIAQIAIRRMGKPPMYLKHDNYLGGSNFGSFNKSAQCCERATVNLPGPSEDPLSTAKSLASRRANRGSFVNLRCGNSELRMSVEGHSRRILECAPE